MMVQLLEIKIVKPNYIIQIYLFPIINKQISGKSSRIYIQNLKIIVMTGMNSITVKAEELVK